MVSTLDLQSQAVTIVYDGSKSEKPPYDPAARMADGNVTILELWGRDGYGQFDVKDIREIVPNPLAWGVGDPPPFTIDAGGKGPVRYWWLHSGPYTLNLREMDGQSFQPLSGTAPGETASAQFGAFVDPESRWMLGGAPRMFDAGKCFVPDTWPAIGLTVYSIGRGDVMWMAMGKGRSDFSTCIVGYRPAPRGSKTWDQRTSGSARSTRPAVR